MFRNFVYKAWVDPKDEPLLIEQAQRIRRTYAKACQFDTMEKGRKYLNTELADIWYATRQMTATWLKGEHARRTIKRKGRPEDDDTEQAAHDGYNGVIGGVLVSANELPYAEFLQRNEKYKVYFKTIKVGEKPLMELTMPLWSRRDGEPFSVRFLMHRPIAGHLLVRRFHLVMRYKRHAGKLVGYTWYVSIMVKMDNPEMRQPRRVGTLWPSWKVEPDGSILVMRLEIDYLDGTKKDIKYHLPPGTISRARRAYHLSIIGQDNIEYNNFDRWRMDTYRKWAVDVCKRVDVIKQVDFTKPIGLEVGSSVPGTIPRHRPLVAVGLLIAAIREKANGSGISFATE